MGALFSWWYSKGWAKQASGFGQYLKRVADFFSIPLLAKTLLQPFRQIGNESSTGSLNMILRAWLDKTVSRFIGFMVRSAMILLGSIWWLLSALGGLLWCLIWPLIPLLPLLGLAMSLGASS